MTERIRTELMVTEKGEENGLKEEEEEESWDVLKEEEEKVDLKPVRTIMPVTPP